jgi:hypothetical protein
MASEAASQPAELRAEYSELIEYILKNFKDRERGPNGLMSRKLDRGFEPRQDNSIHYFDVLVWMDGQGSRPFIFGRDYNTGRYCFKPYGKPYRFFGNKREVEALVIQNLKGSNYI